MSVCQNHYEIRITMKTANMSGLELIQAMIRGEIPRPSMATTMSMRLVEADLGRVMFHATATDRHLNPLGMVHGGFLATVMDSATGAAVHTMLEPGDSYGTIDLNVKMLRPVAVGEPLFAEGKVLNVSRSLGVSEATLKNAEGKLFATATASCMIKRSG